MTERILIELTVNGVEHELIVEPRRTLVDALRHDIGLTGTHVGCEHGVCGACTVLIDGAPTRACLMFAVQAEGREIRTVESLAGADGRLSDLQQAFTDNHGLQCGFCTPGFLMLAQGFLDDVPDPSRAQIREVVASNLCRCTGYQGIVDSIASCAARRRTAREADVEPTTPEDRRAK
ncbi:(2Fe-2S)-binding protein [Mycobacterium sp. 21AC1]|uniref:(2Fe-2S)-binding protein n=1 Tax=[Mycobacterium] appelbergii TaxID=2939269 RepID=UPI002939023F|nr:2Fe-2S iron-sulfur cluster-binding protein [Mycobacterium sp. 21AC1]MDV3130166.1 (2Fe-2S)-binding protein [Mycobacterium sp. 21AC1]